MSLGRVGFVLLLLSLVGTLHCGPSTECIQGISKLTLNSTGSDCTSDCDCNNQAYEGVCVDKLCKSRKREDCASQGAQRPCIVLREAANACKDGVQTCKPDGIDASRWGDCKPLTPTNTENEKDDFCKDGVDNDCDGKTDQSDEDCKDFCSPGKKEPCYDGPEKTLNVGICAGGARLCGDDGKWGACEGQVKPGKETCNRKDDDCDGEVDEGWTSCENFCETPGAKEPCYKGDGCTRKADGTFACVGVCAPGSRTCQSDGTWGRCEGFKEPLGSETCNGKDDDCDGEIDEEVADAQLDQKCTKDGAKGPCAEGRKACDPKTGTFICRSTFTPETERCDPIDNDCDGMINEGLAECVSTFAGSELGDKNGSAAEARFRGPVGLVFDAAGNLYVADAQQIRKIDTTGNVTTFAGSGSQGGFKDGPAAQALFLSPSGLVFDTVGNLYAADRGNHRIRKIDTAGNVTTFAGSGQSGFKDGPGAQAQFNSPVGLAFDSAGNLYVSDSVNHRIRKIDTAGNVTTFAGSGQSGSQDGTGIQAQFNSPAGIVFDGAGNLYVADSVNRFIRKVDPTGVVTTFVRFGAKGAGSFLVGIVFDGAGDLYVTEPAGHAIFKVDKSGNVSLYAGFTNDRGFEEGPLEDARFDSPVGLAIKAGKLYIADRDNRRIRVLLLK